MGGCPTLLATCHGDGQVQSPSAVAEPSSPLAKLLHHFEEQKWQRHAPVLSVTVHSAGPFPEAQLKEAACRRYNPGLGNPGTEQQEERNVVLINLCPLAKLREMQNRNSSNRGKELVAMLSIVTVYRREPFCVSRGTCSNTASSHLCRWRMVKLSRWPMLWTARRAEIGAPHNR